MAIVFDEFDMDNVHLKHPKISRDGQHRSAHAEKALKFQIGEQTEMKCVLLRHKGRGVHIKLTHEDVAQFMHQFEAYVTDYLYDQSESWFGRKIDRANVRRMLCSVINGSDESSPDTKDLKV